MPDTCEGAPLSTLSPLAISGYGIGGYSVGEPHECCLGTLALPLRRLHARNKPVI